MLSICALHHPLQQAMATSDGSQVKRTGIDTDRVVEAQNIRSGVFHITHRPPENQIH